MFLQKFTLYDLILIAAFAAIGLAIKPIINPMVHIITSSIRIPGGSISGGFLMMWMALARVIINKPGTALLFGLAQGFTVMLLGFFGSHGVFSIVSYSLPGLMLEFVAIFVKGQSLLVLCLYSVVANVTGTFLVAWVVMQLPYLPLFISLLSAMISGMMGGFFADIILKKISKYQIFEI